MGCNADGSLRGFACSVLPSGSPSMEGTLLDQRVFESLVAKCLPGIYEHFQSVDVQISVASLPCVLLFDSW